METIRSKKIMNKILTTLFGIGLFVAILVPQSADALTVSPPWFDFRLDPGDVQLDVINLYNENDDSITIYPILTNFTAGDEEGTPKFYPADDNPFGQALTQWITVDETPVTIEPFKRVSIQFAINVPDGVVQPGGHYGAILLSTAPPDVDSGIAIGLQVGALILVNISGEVREVGRIAEFGYIDPQSWYNHLPVDFFVRFENSGNTHLRPAGNLFIKNWWGRQVAAPEVNVPFSSVLPNSIRKFLFGWQVNEVAEEATELEKEWRNFAFGKYTATLVLNYGRDNKIVTDQRVFYVWPWRLLSILGGAVLIAFLLLWLLKKAYEKSIIAAHEAKKKNEHGKKKKKEDKEDEDKEDEGDKVDETKKENDME